MLRRPTFLAGPNPSLFYPGSPEYVVCRFLHLLAGDELALRTEAWTSDPQAEAVPALGHCFVAFDLIRQMSIRLGSEDRTCETRATQRL